MKLGVFFCDGCGNLSSMAGRRYRKVGRRICWFCSTCIAAQKTKPRSRMYRASETSGPHRANNNSTPRLPGSLGVQKPMAGEAVIPEGTKLTVLTTPPERFAVSDDFVGEFQRMGVGRYVDE